MSSRPTAGRRGHKVPRVFAKIILHGVLPVAVLLGGYLAARYLIATAPTTRKRPPAGSTARTVEVVEIRRTTAAPKLEAMGVVKPARVVTLRPRVSGTVTAISPHFAPGGRFASGEGLLGIEQIDFDLAVAQAQATLDLAGSTTTQSKMSLAQATATLAQRHTSLAEAQANLKLEQGNQTIARREFEMLENTRTRANAELVLRAPQLAIAEATVDSAMAGVEAAVAGVATAHAGIEAAQANVRLATVSLRRAELDQRRTTLSAPFNGWIRERYVDVGAVVGTSTNVATLVGTDVYWVEVLIPTSDLKWLSLSDTPRETGASVKVRDDAAWGRNGVRVGRLLRLIGDVESAGRMARLIIAVEDPLHAQAKPAERYPLLIGAYVRVEIEGRAVKEVFVMNRANLRHGDTVWAVDENDKLRIRSVEVRWRGRSRVFVGTGLKQGDRVITTDLGAPVDGMPLRVKGDAPEQDRP